MPANGDLTPWTGQGVMLLNRCLTVGVGHPNSHQGKGWEPVTEAAIRALNARTNADGTPKPLVAVLWGPSPMSARYGFFGSKPFSRANAALTSMGSSPVDWSLPSA